MCLCVYDYLVTIFEIEVDIYPILAIHIFITISKENNCMSLKIECSPS